MFKGFLTLASAAAVAAVMGATSAKADPPWAMRAGPGYGPPGHHFAAPPGHHYGWKRGRHYGWGPYAVPPGWRFHHAGHPYGLVPPRRHHGWAGHGPWWR